LLADEATMTAERDGILLKLPASVAASDAELHAVAVRIFRDSSVRSVSIDGARTVAIVRLKPSVTVDSAGTAFDDIMHASFANVDTSSFDATAALIELVSWTEPRDRSISFIKMPARVRGWRKVVYLLLAGMSLSLGLLGVLLPGLPTTPFVLLGSYFLVRSSARLHERLITSRLFGGVLRDWHLHRGLRPHVRMRAVAVVAFVVAVSLIVARPPLPFVLAILALAAIGLTVIWRLPSVRATAD
jgi:uncharacterized membrane protein YbaN (DUF454 family)